MPGTNIDSSNYRFDARAIGAAARLGPLLAFAIGLAMMMVNLAVAAHGDTTTVAPMTMVKTTVGQVLRVLQDRQTPQAERQRRLLELVAGRFDFAEMARSSLGYNWKKLTPDQQQEFVPLFTAFMEDAYLNKISDYSGQQVRFIGAAPATGSDVEVKSEVVPTDRSQQPIRIVYLLRQEGNDWKVYDVTVDDISITSNYRNQFTRVINNQGFDALISAMHQKQQELRQSIGA